MPVIREKTKRKVLLMANRSKASFMKIEREKARKQKQKDKEARRHQGKASPLVPRTEGEDPDIAGIQPGPQPLPEQFDL
jgi:hypothetical protein